MKQPVQVSRRSNAESARPQPKAATRRVKVRVSPEEKTAIEKAARKCGLTKSQLVERAIRREISQPAGKGRGEKPRRPLVRPAAPKIDRAQHRLVAGPESITARIIGGEDLTGAIRRRDSSGVVKVGTGPIEWTTTDFLAALAAGRFLVTVPNEFHRLALRRGGMATGQLYKEFLAVLSTPLLAELRDSIPLYWIEEHDSGRWLLISLRGELPPGCDPKVGEKSRRALAAEMKLRGLNREACEMLDDVDWIQQHGTPGVINEMKAFLGGIVEDIKAARSQAKGGAN